MKIIIEGPDGAGKSTLADAISRKTGFPVVHLTNVDQDKVDTQFKSALALDNVILDRYILSNKAYNFACGASKASSEVTEACCRDMETPNVVVLCVPGYYKRGSDGCDDYIKHFSKLKAERNEEFTNEEYMRKVWDYMVNAGDAMVLSGRQIPTVYDLFVGMHGDKYFNDTVNSVCDELDRRINEQAERINEKTQGVQTDGEDK